MKRMIRPLKFRFISMTESREFDGNAGPVCEARVKEMLPT
jgi:hypothetical protein